MPAILSTTAPAFGLITFVGAVPALGGNDRPAAALRRADLRPPGDTAGRPAEQYRIAGVLLGIGVVLWVVTVLVNRVRGRRAGELDATRLSG